MTTSKPSEIPTMTTTVGTAPCILMMRHTAVCPSLQGICYGASDVSLGPNAAEDIERCAAKARARIPAHFDIHVVHSGLSRARRLADAIATGLQPTMDAPNRSVTYSSDPRLAEMNFGGWELKAWQAIYLEVGDRMSGLIHEPDTYAAPSGETAHAVRDRVVAWYQEAIASAAPDLATAKPATIVAVSHGGPIAALRGTLAGLPPSEWPNLIPSYGEIVAITEGAAERDNE